MTTEQRPKLEYSTVKLIDVSDWDSFVESVYGKPYSLQQQDGCRQRGIMQFDVHEDEAGSPREEAEWNIPFDQTIEISKDTEEMGVGLGAWMARDPKAGLPGQEYDWQLTLWWKRNFYPDFEDVITDLAMRGILEPGSYVINIDW